MGAFSIIGQEIPMAEKRVTPLRQRMIEDMRIRWMGDKAQKSHIRAIKDIATVLQLVHHRQPEFGTLVLGDPQAQNLTLAIAAQNLARTPKDRA